MTREKDKYRGGKVKAREEEGERESYDIVVCCGELLEGW